MSFGRRLALFFVLIVVVPMVALIGVVVLVSEDSRQGKADARLAAGLETALALYNEHVEDAKPAAESLASDPELGDALRSGDSAQLGEFAARAAQDPRVEGIQVLGPAGTTDASAGDADAIAFAKLDLADDGARRGALRVSVTSAPEFAADLKRLTGRESVVSRGGETLAATAEAPSESDLSPGETKDVQLAQGDYRAHLLTLDEDDGEDLLMLAPSPDKGFLSIGRAAAALLFIFLLVAVALAYVLARNMTRLHSQVAEQAITDPLTGLWNRRRLDQLVDREVERALRFGHELSVLIVDADDFKSINDEHGHLVGDEVLVRIAEVVRRTTRSIDLGARYGGDELAILLIETDRAGAEVVAERLKNNVHEERVSDNQGDSLAVTVSVGGATLPDCAGDAVSLVEAADQALLLAKRAGKDQIRMAPATPRPQANGHGRTRPTRETRAERRRRTSG